jgi:hypothetical protein
MLITACGVFSFLALHQQFDLLTCRRSAWPQLATFIYLSELTADPVRSPTPEYLSLKSDTMALTLTYPNNELGYAAPLPTYSTAQPPHLAFRQSFKQGSWSSSKSVKFSRKSEIRYVSTESLYSGCLLMGPGTWCISSLERRICCHAAVPIR